LRGLEASHRAAILDEDERRDLGDLELLGQLGRLIGVDTGDTKRARSLRARCARRLSIRPAGPDRDVVKKTSSGLSPSPEIGQRVISQDVVVPRIVH
jgi:hypothetical protein